MSPTGCVAHGAAMASAMIAAFGYHDGVKFALLIVDRDVKLEYDDQDRLIKETQLDDKSEMIMFITTYTYDCH